MDPITSAKAAEETAKAAQEVAKTTGKAIDAGREAGGYLARLCGGTLEQAAGILEDRLRYTRWERRVRLLAKARAFAAEHGMPEPTRRVPLSLLVPLLEAGAAEEDDALQDTWAAMLVNTANADHGGEVRRAYISILADCTRLDVRLLAMIHDVPPEARQKQIFCEFLPEEVIWSGKVPNISRHLIHRPDILQSLWNLYRLGLIAGQGEQLGDAQINTILITALGIGLVEACTLRDRNAPAQDEPTPPAS